MLDRSHTDSNADMAWCFATCVAECSLFCQFLLLYSDIILKKLVSGIGYVVKLVTGYTCRMGMYIVNSKECFPNLSQFC